MLYLYLFSHPGRKQEVGQTYTRNRARKIELIMKQESREDLELRPLWTGERSMIGYQIPTLFLSQFVRWSAQKLPAAMVPLFRVMPLSQNIFWKCMGISVFGYILEGDTDNTTQCLSAQ